MYGLEFRIFRQSSSDLIRHVIEMFILYMNHLYIILFKGKKLLAVYEYFVEWYVSSVHLNGFYFIYRKEKDSSEDKSEPFTRQISHGDPAKPFLQALAESKVEDETALKFLAAVERFCKQKRFVLPIEFPADHPVEKVGRMLMACLLKHQELGIVEELCSV